MSKQSRNPCGWKCCPSGFIEHVKHYRYLKQFTDITFIEYWKWEIECLLGMHKADDDESKEQ